MCRGVGDNTVTQGWYKIIRGSENRNNITKGNFFICKLSIKDVILSLFIMSYECLFYYGC
ncbi:hypothetical protein FYS93_13265 [Escherichia coli]|nr:hypothetical protein [Escherichia coli]EFA5284646.1 hypothetical protein [Escherichia coli]